MDTQLQTFLTRIQADVASNAKTWIPAPSKLDLESIISACVVMIGFWLASLLVKKVAEKFFAVRKIDETLSRFLIRVMRVSLIGLGVVTGLGTLGIDVSAIVAGLGLTGVAMGIALKDVVANAFSGIMLLVFRPFRHCDLIKVGEFEGVVCDIDLRYTHIKAQGRMIFIPNSHMFSNAVSVLEASVAGQLPIQSAAPLLPSVNNSGERDDVTPSELNTSVSSNESELRQEMEPRSERANPLLLLVDDCKVAA